MSRGLGLAATLVALLTLAPAALAAGSLQPPTASPDPTFGKPLTFTVSGTTPGPNPYGGYTAYELELALHPASWPCEQYEYDDLSVQSRELSYQVWDVSNANGSFARAYAAPTTYSDSPDRLPFYPGSYRQCAWLWDSQADNTATGYAPDHGRLAMAESTFTVRAPRFTISLHLQKPLRIQPIPPPIPRPDRLTMRIKAEVGGSRAVFATVQPPGARRCPKNILESTYWNESVFFPSSPRLNESGGLDLRAAGPLAYNLGIAVVGGQGPRGYVGARPGRSLLCAGIYDTYDKSAPAGEEAAAQMWIRVRPGS